MKRAILALGLILSLFALTFPQGGLIVVQRRAANSTPPLPSFSNVVGVWGLWNFDPVGYPTGGGVECLDADFTEVAFVGTAPYPLNWDLAVGGTLPFLLNTWRDQNQANVLTQSGGARPVLDATNKLISFDGAAQGLLSFAELYPDGGSTTGTIYLDYQPLDLVSTAVIFETGTGTAGGLAQNISIRQVGAVLTCSVYDDTAVIALANTKIVTLANTNRIWIAFTFDSTNGTAANQTALKVNNSATGVSSPISTNLHSLQIGNAQLSLGARNNAASAYNHCNMWLVRAQNNVDNAAAHLVEYSYNQYLKSLP